MTLKLTGQRFGRLVVVKRSKFNNGKNTAWECLCDCGTTKTISGYHLRRGDTVSCGCYKNEVTSKRSKKHGHASNGKRKCSATYNSWTHMKDRCLNPNNDRYHDYGGRGVNLCKRWEEFENFLEDMGKRPKNCSIERINNSGDYSPDNCKWATVKEQINNRRTTKLFTIEGETKCMLDWANHFGISYWTVMRRNKKGIPFTEIIAELTGGV